MEQPEEIWVPGLYSEFVLRKHAELVAELMALTDEEYEFVTGEKRGPIAS